MFVGFFQIMGIAGTNWHVFSGVKTVSKKEKAKQSKQKWVLIVVCISFALSVVMSFITSVFVESAGIFVALMSLIVLIAIGIVTDIVGMAVASATEQPFIAMASKRIAGAKQSLWLIRRAEKVSSMLNDVVGDIVGIVSGSAGSVIAVYLVSLGLKSAVASMLVTAFTSAFMIGGKAYGKGIAIEYSDKIVMLVGRVMAFFSMKRKKLKQRKNPRRQKYSKEAR